MWELTLISVEVTVTDVVTEDVAGCMDVVDVVYVMVE